MRFLEVLSEESLLLESGVRIPKGITSAKILHHDDFDGVMIEMKNMIKKLN